MTVTVGEIVQINFVVDDIDVAMKSWLATKQTGPFLVLRHVDDLPVTYRGRKTDLDISIAFAQLGSIHVELIQQHNDGRASTAMSSGRVRAASTTSALPWRTSRPLARDTSTMDSRSEWTWNSVAHLWLTSTRSLLGMHDGDRAG